MRGITPGETGDKGEKKSEATARLQEFSGDATVLAALLEMKDFFLKSNEELKMALVAFLGGK